MAKIFLYDYGYNDTDRVLLFDTEENFVYTVKM